MKNFLEQYELQDKTITGLFTALAGTIVGGNFAVLQQIQNAKEACEDLFSEWKATKVVEIHHEITQMREHVNAGFKIINKGKENGAVFEDLIDNRELHYNPYTKEYSLYGDDEQFSFQNTDYLIIRFKMDNPKSAIYFAKQVL